nr:hypothetical protein [Tanacetum cinerariifolium]
MLQVIPTASDEFLLPDYFLLPVMKIPLLVYFATSLVRSFDQEKNKHSSSAEEENGLAQVEARLVEHRNQELKYCEKIRVLEFNTESRANSSKDLDNLLKSQRLDKNKEGLGYSVVPPPPTQIYSPPKKDLSWTGVPEFADDTITDYSRPSPAIKSTSDDVQNKNTFDTKTEASPSTISPKPFIKFVKTTDKPTENKTDKVETTKKPAVKYAELYRKPSKGSKVRGNQRNWNNLKFHQLGTNFVMKKKACFNCGDFDHLAYDCCKWVKKGTSRPHNNTHKSMPPRPAIHRPYRPPIRPTRPNTNVATRSNVNNARTQTTQDLMVILIQRVKMLERELKARTLHTKIQKVNRGRSTSVMAWVPKKMQHQVYERIVGNKMLQVIPTASDEFPLLDYFPLPVMKIPLLVYFANVSAKEFPWLVHFTTARRKLDTTYSMEVDTSYQVIDQNNVLELIQEDNTHPFENTSERHDEVEPTKVEPHSMEVPSRRSRRISQTHNRYDPKFDKWLDAMNIEMQSIKDNQVWCLIDLPHNGRIIRSKWLFKKKTNMDGNLHTFKARRVAKGYTQTYGVGEATYILGIKITRDRSERLIALSESTYFDKKILKKFKIENSKHGSVPCKRSLTIEIPKEQKHLVRAVDGKSAKDVMPSNQRPMEMLCDSAYAIEIANDPRIIKGARHYQRKYHYIREVIRDGEIILKKVHIDDNLVDPFTKPMPYNKHFKHAMAIGVCPTSSLI